MSQGLGDSHENNVAPRAECDDIARLVTNGQRASLSGDGQLAIALYEEAYIRSRAAGERHVAADALFAAARQARMNSEPAASLQFATLIFDLADRSSPQMVLKGYLALGHHLMNAGRDGDVLAMLRQAELSFATSGISDLCEFLELYACASAMQGSVTQAVGHFDTLLAISERHDSIDTQISRLSSAATNAVTLGLVERARLLHRRSSGLATQYALGYRVPLSALTQAWTCLLSGDLREARALLEAAEASPSNHLYVRLFRSAIGVLLGVLTRCDDLVDRCLDLGALEVAFKSEAPQRIGPIAAAVLEYHQSRGRSGAAAELLSRSIRAIDNPDDCWWLLLKAAESGSQEDVQRGLAVLAGYTENFLLARAHRLMLHARSARLDNRPHTAVNLASEAADLLGTLGWQCHRAVALELAERYVESRHLNEAIGASGRPDRTKLAGRRAERTKLTPREREVVRLAISGLTNRLIAERLGIAERTVKYYLTVAFNVLGCQNREDLGKFVEDGSCGL
jgi:DNA-binding CsgD family transcriptional regulator